jgi:hypothetical protein
MKALQRKISIHHPLALLYLPHAARLQVHHSRGLLATEAFGELRQILEHGVGAVLIGGVGIGLRLGAQLLGAGLCAPLPRIGNSETLLGGQRVVLEPAVTTEAVKVLAEVDSFVDERRIEDAQLGSGCGGGGA